ncbi:MAG: hypothetical protein NVSMB69_10110 [Novosphingobium sp.]
MVKAVVRSVCAVVAMLAFIPGAGAAPENAGAAGSRVLAVARAANVSGEVALGDAGGSMFDQATGLADRERGRPHRSGARWLWASVTKQVTATMVMQQVEAGRLVLDQPIHPYLPWFAGPSGDKVTIRHLLLHLSGLPNPNDTKPDAQDVQAFYTETGATTGDLARAASARGRRWPPRGPDFPTTNAITSCSARSWNRSAGGLLPHWWPSGLPSRSACDR